MPTLPFVDKRAQAGLIIGAGLAGCLSLLPTHVEKRLTEEGGIIENLSAGLLGIVVVACAIQLWRKPSRLWLAGLLGAVWMCLRELDFQRRFTPRSIESIGFYSNPSISLEMKLLVLLALLPFLIAGVQLALAAWKSLPEGVSSRRPWLGYLGIAVGLAATAMIFEKQFEMSTALIEEICELLFAYFVLLLVLAFTRNSDGREAAVKDEPGMPVKG